MQNFQDTFETPKQSFINTFSICITVPLTKFSSWQGDWALDYHYMKFRHFPDIS